MEKCICKKIKKNESLLISNGQWNTLELEKNDWDEYYIVAKADGNAYIKINYCPFCGRKLSDNIEHKNELLKLFMELLNDWETAEDCVINECGDFKDYEELDRIKKEYIKSINDLLEKK